MEYCQIFQIAIQKLFIRRYVPYAVYMYKQANSLYVVAGSYSVKFTSSVYPRYINDSSGTPILEHITM